MFQLTRLVLPTLQKSLSRYCSQNIAQVSESSLKSVLQKEFPKAKSIEVQDVSGGCGAMFEIVVISPEFKGLSTVKQHMMINKALKAEIKEMHGLRIHTEAE